MLAGRVAGAADQRRESGHAGDRGDEAAPCDELGQGGVRQVQGTKKVDFHDAADDLDPRLAQQTALADAGVVDEAVERAKALERGGHGVLANGRVGDVAGQGERLCSRVPQLKNHGLQALRVAVHGGDQAAGAGVAPAQRLAQPACGAADQHHPGAHLPAAHAAFFWRAVRHRSNTSAELSRGT